MSAGNLIGVRRRLRSVKNIQQITRAMKFVAASKLRRAQNRIFAARPYANRMLAVLNSLATRVDPAGHPLLVERNTDKIMLLVITADRGLCGAFSSNIIKAVMHYLEDKTNKQTVHLTLVGRKGVDWFRRRPWPIRNQYINIMNRVNYKYAQEIAHSVIGYYASSQLDAVYLVYNEFKSVTQQKIVIEPLLPVQHLEVKETDVFLDYIYEQPQSAIFNDLLPRHVETQIFRAMLESEASEQGARMTAMDAATRNAKDVTERLTLYMNRLRQATITKELIEIVSGADALKGDH